MTVSSKRKLLICLITVLICISLLKTQAFSLSLEQEVSRRQSMRSYTSENISKQQLLDVLRAAYGHTNDRKNLPRIGYDYSLIVFAVNETGSYRYIPESNSLVIHDLTVNKETIRPHDSGWPSDAKEVLVIVWNETRMDNHYFASAEAGCLAQNVHLAASSLGLGICIVATINSGGLRSVLQLPSTITPLLVMPLSYPTNQYPVATPKYDIMTGNLPSVQYSVLSFEDAVKNIVFAQE
jgi:nitroreductase